MVNPGKRMNILQQLLSLRQGPGAAILPPEITRIHLHFAKRWNNGHMGPRRFWRECLPRLKFWNPAVPMLVNRTDDNSSPAKMSIYFRQEALDSNKPSTLISKFNSLPLAQQAHSSIKNEYPAPEPEEGERVVTIDMRQVHSETILKEFMAKTGATIVEPTFDELAEMTNIKQREQKAALDRAVMRKYIDDRKREERMLAIARQEAEAIRLANQ
ncbi:CI-B8 domain-containing protein [Annulohypoxylon maeteangense]|uniref:CI-B8 domain-containing protein n=1 Tax=Annulohypoxylon maeteangense TaxID=1927788 RepID=UPI002007B98D|nr:CI-B8 domain-containing protein [Annulohypoxylon maeteangense]KAI0884732.1 CI-B8 domain-containing protein [Annulohypoxylon maeteangense]